MAQRGNGLSGKHSLPRAVQRSSDSNVPSLAPYLPPVPLSHLGVLSICSLPQMTLFTETGSTVRKKMKTIGNAKCWTFHRWCFQKLMSRKKKAFGGYNCLDVILQNNRLWGLPGLKVSHKLGKPECRSPFWPPLPGIFLKYSYTEPLVPDLPRSFLPREIMSIKGEKLQMEEP